MELNGEQWKQIHKLDHSTIRTIYSLYQKPFLVEVRENLSEWIEGRFLDSNLDANNPTHHPYILQLIGDLDAEIKAKAVYLSTQDSNSFTAPVKLSIAANMISSGNPMHPISLFQHICHCLHSEREFIRQYYERQATTQPQPTHQSNLTPTPSSEPGILDMMTNCDDLKVQTSVIHRLVNQIQCAQEDLILKTNTLQNIERTISQYTTRGLGQPNQVLSGDRELEKKLLDEKAKLERWILEHATNTNRKLMAVQDLQSKLFDSTKIFQAKVLQCLSNWKEEQETTSRHVISIEQVQQWFDGLVQVIAEFIIHLKDNTALEQNYNSVPVFVRNAIASGNIQVIRQDYNNEITQLLNELIQQAFIVESQPQQLLKKGKKIAVKVRFLIGRSLQLPLSLQSVQASILNEAGVKEFISTVGNGTLTTCGELVNSLQKFELDAGSSGYVADFRNLQIKTIKQKKRKDAGDSILDDSYWLVFRAEFNYNGVTHKVSVLSVPTKITSHGSQELRAWETLIWDAADKHQKSDSVPWTQLAKILNNRFTMMTKRGLTEDQMKVVEDRAFSVPGGINPINGVRYITKSQFCKTNIPKMGFTFWNWFYEIAKLTSEHLCGNKFCKSGPWQDNLIIGFISRERAFEILKNIGKHGTFLLRFSDSQLGAITITWVHPEGRDVRSVAPFTSKDLTYRPLAERILDIENLLTLYPNKEKVQSFKPYVLPPPEGDNAYLKRYVRSELKTILKDNHGEPMPVNVTPQMSPAPGISSPRCSDSGTSDYSCGSGVSSGQSVGSQSLNSNDNSSEGNDHWINAYYPEDPNMNESPDIAQDVSLEDYDFSSDEFISFLTESIKMDK